MQWQRKLLKVGEGSTQLNCNDFLLQMLNFYGQSYNVGGRIILPLTCAAYVISCLHVFLCHACSYSQDIFSKLLIKETKNLIQKIYLIWYKFYITFSHLRSKEFISIHNSCIPHSRDATTVLPQIVEAAAAQWFGCQPVIQKILVQFPDGAVCCCSLEQGTLYSN